MGSGPSRENRRSGRLRRVRGVLRFLPDVVGQPITPVQFRQAVTSAIETFQRLLDSEQRQLVFRHEILREILVLPYGEVLKGLLVEKGGPDFETRARALLRTLAVNLQQLDELLSQTEDQASATTELVVATHERHELAVDPDRPIRKVLNRYVQLYQDLSRVRVEQARILNLVRKSFQDAGHFASSIAVQHQAMRHLKSLGDEFHLAVAATADLASQEKQQAFAALSPKLQDVRNAIEEIGRCQHRASDDQELWSAATQEHEHASGLFHELEDEARKIIAEIDIFEHRVIPLMEIRPECHVTVEHRDARYGDNVRNEFERVRTIEQLPTLRVNIEYLRDAIQRVEEAVGVSQQESGLSSHEQSIQRVLLATYAAMIERTSVRGRTAGKLIAIAQQVDLLSREEGALAVEVLEYSTVPSGGRPPLLIAEDHQKLRYYRFTEWGSRCALQWMSTVLGPELITKIRAEKKRRDDTIYKRKKRKQQK